MRHYFILTVFFFTPKTPNVLPSHNRLIYFFSLSTKLQSTNKKKQVYQTEFLIPKSVHIIYTASVKTFSSQ